VATILAGREKDPVLGVVITTPSWELTTKDSEASDPRFLSPQSLGTTLCPRIRRPVTTRSRTGPGDLDLEATTSVSERRMDKMQGPATRNIWDQYANK